jgi:hypothetical protein
MPNEPAFLLLRGIKPPWDRRASNTVKSMRTITTNTGKFKEIAVFDIMLLLKRAVAALHFTIRPHAIQHYVSSQIQQTRHFTQRHGQDVAKDSFTE